MDNFTLCLPTELVFGKDTHKKTGELCKKHGATKVFIVYGSDRIKKTGLLDEVTASIEAEGIKVMSMGGVVPNPKLSTAREMVKAAIDFGADLILALGGGSVADTAKAVAHGVANPDTDIWDFWWNGVPLTKSTKVGVIITLAATGSEMSNSSVLTNDVDVPSYKKGINTQLNRPAFSILNPELTMTLPKYQVAAGAADIFLHTSERYFGAPGQPKNNLTDEFAEGLMRNIIKFGPIGVEHPDYYEAMSEIMATGAFSHNGITGMGVKNNGDWACHQFSMPLSSIYDATHGAALAAVWATWARYVCDADISRFAKFARKVWNVEEEDDARAAEEGIKKQENWFRTIGMPISITELLGRRPSDEEVDEMALNCSWQKKRTVGQFKVIDYEAMKDIFSKARQFGGEHETS